MIFLKFSLTAISVSLLDQKLDICYKLFNEIWIVKRSQIFYCFPIKIFHPFGRLLKVFPWFSFEATIVVETLLSSLEWALVDEKFSPFPCLPMWSTSNLCPLFCYNLVKGNFRFSMLFSMSDEHRNPCQVTALIDSQKLNQKLLRKFSFNCFKTFSCVSTDSRDRLAGHQLHLADHKYLKEWGSGEGWWSAC